MITSGRIQKSTSTATPAPNSTWASNAFLHLRRTVPARERCDAVSTSYQGFCVGRKNRGTERAQGRSGRADAAREARLLRHFLLFAARASEKSRGDSGGPRSVRQ